MRTHLIRSATPSRTLPMLSPPNQPASFSSTVTAQQDREDEWAGAPIADRAQRAPSARMSHSSQHPIANFRDASLNCWAPCVAPTSSAGALRHVSTQMDLHRLVKLHRGAGQSFLLRRAPTRKGGAAMPARNNKQRRRPPHSRMNKLCDVRRRERCHHMPRFGRGSPTWTQPRRLAFAAGVSFCWPSTLTTALLRQWDMGTSDCS